MIDATFKIGMLNVPRLKETKPKAFEIILA